MVIRLKLLRILQELRATLFFKRNWKRLILEEERLKQWFKKFNCHRLSYSYNYS